MQKIPTALKRDPNNRAKVLPEITPGCEWVFLGEGIPTRKWDGTCVMLDEQGKWWSRREVKPGKTPPENFVEVHKDDVTGKTQGWEPIEQSSFAKFHEEALRFYTPRKAGTYELIGPSINKNPENVPRHAHAPHEYSPAVSQLLGLTDPEHIMEVLKKVCESHGYEGVVWHHPDGRMAKLKVRDL